MKNFRILLSAILVVLLLPVIAQDSLQHSTKVKYVFLFIGDGMGLAQVNLTQACLDAENGESGYGQMSFTRFPYTGLISTYSSSSLTSCSSAAGTALATGKKTANGRLSMAPGGDTIYQTIAEKAHEAGMKAGIVTSVSIDHATPASFYAHNTMRSNYFEIGIDLSRSGFDYFAGGGFLQPDGKLDGRPANVLTEAKKNGYTIVDNREDFKNLMVSNKVLVLSPVQGNHASLPFTLGSNPANLSLADFTAKGIRVLTNPNGYFMMIEGGKIDWACHENDAATMVNEVKAFDGAIHEALKVYKLFPEETIIVVTADHETGGLSLGSWSTDGEVYPSLLLQQKTSVENFSNYLVSYRKKSSGDRDQDFERFMIMIGNEFGFNSGDAKATLTEEEIQQLKNSFIKSMNSTSDSDLVFKTAIGIMNNKAGIGWSTSGHTATAVPVYAIGAGAERFTGFHDNTDIPKILEELMGLDK